MFAIVHLPFAARSLRAVAKDFVGEAAKSYLKKDLFFEFFLSWAERAKKQTPSLHLLRWDRITPAVPPGLTHCVHLSAYGNMPTFVHGGSYAVSHTKTANLFVPFALGSPFPAPRPP